MITDLFDHDQLAGNFAKLDIHDHTLGRGVQIPTDGIADGAITSTKLATALDPSPAYTTYKYVREGGASVAVGIVTSANPYGLTTVNPITAVGTRITVAREGHFYFDPARHAVSGRSTVLRIDSHLENLGATASTITYTLSLYPIASVSAGVFTIGGAVAGSTHTFAPAAIVGNAMIVNTSNDFAAPAAGFYALGFIVSGTTDAAVNLKSTLLVRQV